MGVFYRPPDGFVGDVIPFYWKGTYHAFYLKAPLPPKRHGANGTPYAHLVSTDLAHWEEWSLAIEPGASGEPDDVSCFTGSVIERDGTYSLFYTGFRGDGVDQTICRATSSDLRTWEKDPGNPILIADPRWYESIDWRDPFVFWNEDAVEYWMLLAACVKQGPSNRRGCIALATSPTLESWTVHPPFWSPSLYFTHECPDMFRWNNQWTLAYSTFTERHVTHFRTSPSINGPWQAPTNDTFDGRAFYAAKTASDGQRRFVFGWNPTREGETDSGKWQWAGNMVVHELDSASDGRLIVKVPSSVENLFSKPEPTTFKPLLGNWQYDDSTYSVDCPDGFAAATLGKLPDCCEITCTLSCDANTRSCGLLFRAAPGLESYYQLRWEPGRRRVVVDRWPRPGDEPFMLEQPFEAADGDSVTIKLFLDGSVVVAYVGDQIALNCRAYDHSRGELGLFVAEGAAKFSSISVKSVN